MDDSEIVAKFPFVPMNGFLVISDDGRGRRQAPEEPLMGTVLSVCKSLEGEIKTGDRVLYDESKYYNFKNIRFGKVSGLLVNVEDIFGYWDIERSNSIFNAQRGEPGKITSGVKFKTEVDSLGPEECIK